LQLTRNFEQFVASFDGLRRPWRVRDLEKKGHNLCIAEITAIESFSDGLKSRHLRCKLDG
jgi:hypothetical protein